MIERCIGTIITYSMEACNQKKEEMGSINIIMDNRILMVPPTTPRELLYIEMGLLDMETTITKNRIYYVNREVNTNRDTLVK